MTATKNLGIPNQSYDYGAFKWHLKWTIDVLNRQAIHSSGMIFRFTNECTGEEKPPLGGTCPNGAWFGRLEGGSTTIPIKLKQHVAIRVCREALQLFADMARFACQDCMQGTVEKGDYYMVHNHVWKEANPKNAGTLCLPCLQQRLGRRMTLLDFSRAFINLYNNRIFEFCADGDQVQLNPDI